MAMTQEIQLAIRGFKDVILGGIPVLLRQNETAFLSFMCSLAAIDALAGYRYNTGGVGERFKNFIIEYFPAEYTPHADNLYLLRCRILHNFSPAYFTLTHGNQALHLTTSDINDTILSDVVIFSDLEKAVTKFFIEVQVVAERQNSMNERLLNIDKGGAIYY